MPETELNADTTLLGGQLRKLVDSYEIADLVSHLGLWLDEKRFEEAPSIFTEDVAVQTPGGTAQGIERVADQARRNHSDLTQTQHVFTNILVDLDGDRAMIRANLIVYFAHRAAEPEPYFTLGARYRFEAVRAPQGWRFSQMRIIPVWSSGSRDGGSLAQATSPEEQQ